MPAALTCAPVFIVGCPRSGTTLLRLMLNSHPALAIPDESHFIVELYRRRPRPRRTPSQTLERVFDHTRFARWGLDPAVVRQLAATTSPCSYAETMEVVFAAYAAAHDKPRWGDKSPPYTSHIPLLAGLFPQAQFVHIIRDGRDVAASLAAQAWGPPSPIAGALAWKAHVSKARNAAQKLPPERYVELRLERLISEPEPVLRELCDFLNERFAPEMLEYHRAQAQPVWSGSPEDAAHVDHRHLNSPPTSGLRDWRAGLSQAEQRAVEAAGQPLLSELGYSAGTPALRALIQVELDRLRWLPRNLDRDARRRTKGLGHELRSRYRDARQRRQPRSSS